MKKYQLPYGNGFQEVTLPEEMLMYGKVTHMNLIDSRLLFPEAQDIITCPAFCICL